MTSPIPDGLVRILPMPGVALPEGVALKVQDVDPETAELLTAPISRHDDARRFVTDPAQLPAGWEPPDPDHLVTDAPAPDTADDAAAPAAPSRRPTRRSARKVDAAAADAADPATAQAPAPETQED